MHVTFPTSYATTSFLTTITPHAARYMIRHTHTVNTSTACSSPHSVFFPHHITEYKQLSFPFLLDKKNSCLTTGKSNETVPLHFTNFCCKINILSFRKEICFETHPLSLITQHLGRKDLD
jgi:hypothetical protein